MHTNEADDYSTYRRLCGLRHERRIGAINFAELRPHFVVVRDGRSQLGTLLLELAGRRSDRCGGCVQAGVHVTLLLFQRGDLKSWRSGPYLAWELHQIQWRFA